MSTAIQGFGQQLPPATNYSQSLSFDGQEPPGGPKPPPDTVQSAFNDSRVAAATFTPSEAASVLLSALPAATPAADAAKPPPQVAPPPSATAPAGTPLQSQTVTTQAQNPQLSVVAQQKSEATNPVKQFEKSQGPPPFTLRTANPNPNKINQKPLYAHALTPFQVRQFSDLIKSLRSITSAVLPNFSYSA